MEHEGGYWEHGFKPKAPIPGIEHMGEAETGLLEGHNAKPEGKKYDYEADGEGSKGPAAR